MLERRRVAAGWLVASAVFAVTGCGGGGTAPESASALDQPVTPLAPAPAAALSVQSITKLAERRIERAVYEYDYSVTVLSTTAVSGVTVTLSQVGAGTTIIRPTTTLGPLAAGVAGTSTGFVSFRHDRELPFLEGALRWDLRSP
ncbi:MAG: hypothetical protein Q8N44_12475 [Rubrivivax sp.]|nr:hypothetical protein [Rubrivivax sp.]MDP3084483.1 hypothetical protein [Rubrivivax sp.]